MNGVIGKTTGGQAILSAESEIYNTLWNHPDVYDSGTWICGMDGCPYGEEAVKAIQAVFPHYTETDHREAYILHHEILDKLYQENPLEDSADHDFSPEIYQAEFVEKIHRTMYVEGKRDNYKYAARVQCYRGEAD